MKDASARVTGQRRRGGAGAPALVPCVVVSLYSGVTTQRDFDLLVRQLAHTLQLEVDAGRGTLEYLGNLRNRYALFIGSHHLLCEVFRPRLPVVVGPRDDIGALTLPHDGDSAGTMTKRNDSVVGRKPIRA